MKTNYHTHTTFCDGKNTPEEMVLTAIDKGFSVLGFSGHGIWPYNTDWHTPTDKYGNYVAEIRRLAQKYSSKLKILVGFEVDYFPPYSKPDRASYAKYSPDYIIGSVHYIANTDLPAEDCIKEPDKFPPSNSFTVDGILEEIKDGITRIFNNDTKRIVQLYFSQQRDMALNCDFDIIGHPDIIRKRNNVLKFFDESESWYKRELQATADAFAKSGKIVEINTGGMAKKCLDDTYPSDDFLKMLQKLDVPVMINSDAHSADVLDFGFDYAQKKARIAGFSEFAIL